MTASPTVEELLTESAAVARIPGRDAEGLCVAAPGRLTLRIVCVAPASVCGV